MTKWIVELEGADALMGNIIDAVENAADQHRKIDGPINECLTRLSRALYDAKRNNHLYVVEETDRQDRERVEELLEERWQLAAAIRAELDHAYFNGHVLDANSEHGVGPGELVEAVRASSIEAVLQRFKL